MDLREKNKIFKIDWKYIKLILRFVVLELMRLTRREVLKLKKAYINEWKK